MYDSNVFFVMYDTGVILRGLNSNSQSVSSLALFVTSPSKLTPNAHMDIHLYVYEMNNICLKIWMLVSPLPFVRMLFVLAMKYWLKSWGMPTAIVAPCLAEFICGLSYCNALPWTGDFIAVSAMTSEATGNPAICSAAFWQTLLFHITGPLWGESTGD